MNSYRLFYLPIIIFALIFSANNFSQAATYIVQFGGSFGLSYSPNNLPVSVGDTIRWVGSFTSHPMSSTQIPGGAQPWVVASGDDFEYVVLVPGIYNYQCDAHFNLGMVGSFEAVTTGVSNSGTTPEVFILHQNFPNPFNPSTNVTFEVPYGSRIILKAYNVIGKKVDLILDEIKNAGIYTIEWNPQNISGGVYFIQLKADNFLDTKRVVLIK